MLRHLKITAKLLIRALIFRQDYRAGLLILSENIFDLCLDNYEPISRLMFRINRKKGEQIIEATMD